jgi:hypothetical protein
LSQHSEQNPDANYAIARDRATIAVSDTFTGTTLSDLLSVAGDVSITAKNDILSKHVSTAGSDAVPAMFAP